MIAKVNINYEEWQRVFDAGAKQANDKMADIHEAAAYELFERVVERTPVGKPETWSKAPGPFYVPGTLKHSWRLDSGQVRDAGGRFASIASIREGNGLALKPVSSFVLSNSRPYAERIENGWSKQAPVGMLGVTVAEWPDIVAQATKDS